MDNKSIMVAVDFGSTSNRALDSPSSWRRSWRRRSIWCTSARRCHSGQTEIDTPYVDAANAELTTLSARAESAGVTREPTSAARTSSLGCSKPSTSSAPQFVVVGSHGRSGVARVLMGSISESLTRRSHVPVLIVPAPEREKIAKLVAWSCRDCGHILADGESAESCPRCGEFPAHWLSAAITSDPATSPARLLVSIARRRRRASHSTCLKVAGDRTQGGPHVHAHSDPHGDPVRLVRFIARRRARHRRPADGRSDERGRRFPNRRRHASPSRWRSPSRTARMRRRRWRLLIAERDHCARLEQCAAIVQG